MRRQFVESEGFRKRVDSLGGPGLLKSIQEEILRNPLSGDLVSGTGGIRKIRVAKPGRGKSGSYRVFYFDLPDEEVTHLMFLLLKGERENVTKADRNALKEKVELLKKEARKKR